MTLAQRLAWQALKRDGFRLVVEAAEVVRVTRNGDNRAIMRDGQQKRGHHVDPAPGGRCSSRKG